MSCIDYNREKEIYNRYHSNRGPIKGVIQSNQEKDLIRDYNKYEEDRKAGRASFYP